MPDRHEGDLQERLHDAYDEEVDYNHRALLWAWVAFGATFAVVRGITYSIREGFGPFGDVSVGDVHLHHYVWGILLLAVVTWLAIVGTREERKPWLGTGFGIAMALIVDEYALLLNLEDVYWADEGRASVDVALGAIAVLGVVTAAWGFWRRVTRELGRGLHDLG